MRRWEQILFGLFSIVILVVLGLKLHELDMPAARFVRSFDIYTVNRTGDMLGLLGEGVVIGGVFAVIGVVGWWVHRERWRQLGLRGVIALLAVGIVSQLLKHLIGRPRPRFAHADEFTLGPSMETGLDSFPSGHAINSFSAAAVVTWFFPQWRAPLLLTAGLISISRVVRGSHFPTDIFAGAILGWLVGSLVATGMRRWTDKLFQALIQLGGPLVIFIFLGFWVALHQAPNRSQGVPHLAVGGALLVLGIFLRASAAGEKLRGARLHALGSGALALGVAAACGPWWVAGLLCIALLPGVLDPARPAALSSARRWRREALVFTTALAGVGILLSLQGLLPIGA
jgi:membrane-associated phospholipid phosphatase